MTNGGNVDMGHAEAEFGNQTIPTRQNKEDKSNQLILLKQLIMRWYNIKCREIQKWSIKSWNSFRHTPTFSRFMCEIYGSRWRMKLKKICTHFSSFYNSACFTQHCQAESLCHVRKDQNIIRGLRLIQPWCAPEPTLVTVGSDDQDLSLKLG